MSNLLRVKLSKITDIWNNFILKFGYCNKKIKFDDDVKTNYFGDILHYFMDTFDIIFNEDKLTSYSDKFSKAISLLQAIYIHQDFIEELLLIFKIPINKGDLKKDSNYIINRELRNELVGHPIRKYKGKLVSSTSFAYQEDIDSIYYLKYHKDNNFNGEGKKYPIKDIVDRHFKFIDYYFDKILIQLKKHLRSYKKELDNLQIIINRNDFKSILIFVFRYFESITELKHLYNKNDLELIYERKEEHVRYKTFINTFITDLQSYLKEYKNDIDNLMEPEKIIPEITDNNIPRNLEVRIVSGNNSPINNNEIT